MPTHTYIHTHTHILAFWFALCCECQPHCFCPESCYICFMFPFLWPASCSDSFWISHSNHQFHLNSFSINLSFQEVDKLWSRFREMKYYIPCTLMDPLQWMGAVRMRVQAADKSMTIIHNTILDDKSMFCKVKSCIFVIKNYIIMF